MIKNIATFYALFTLYQCKAFLAVLNAFKKFALLELVQIRCFSLLAKNYKLLKLIDWLILQYQVNDRIKLNE